MNLITEYRGIFLDLVSVILTLTKFIFCPKSNKELKAKLNQENCFELPPLNVIIAPFCYFVLQVVLYYFAILSNSIILTLADFIFLVLLTLQLLYFSHDAIHKTVSTHSNLNLVYGFLGISLVASGSFTYWKEKHLKHHKYCHQEKNDPDISAPFFLIYKQPVINKADLIKYNIKWQHYTVWVLSFFYWIEFRRRSSIFIIKNIITYRWHLCKFDLLLNMFHFFIYLCIPYFLKWNFIYLLIYWLLWTTIGVLLVPIFMVNHVGMPISKETGLPTDFCQQIESSRNIKLSPIIGNAIMGGLNYQIEHHIFPNMHRSKYKLASVSVKEFCQKNNIVYKEVSFLEGLLETFKYLKLMSAKK